MLAFPIQSPAIHRSPARKAEPASIEEIESKIRVVRGHAVLLDFELAAIYGVSTRRLMEQVLGPEPLAGELCFPPERGEVAAQAGGNVEPALPYAFTEHGAFLAGVLLNSREAMAMSVRVVRAFIRHRERRANGGTLGAQRR